MSKIKAIPKITEFEGYISGDYECFCLSKVPFEEWRKTQDDTILLYPSDFFQEELEGKKCHFKITVEAFVVDEGIEK